jgi:imidazolonepropionase-like amidohydrolase
MRQEHTKHIGFVDAHVHLKHEDALACAAAAGIAAVRDAGTKEGHGLSLGRDRQGIPMVVTAGWALHKKGGYGSHFGAPIETRQEMRSEILELKRRGADIIKVMASGVVSLKKSDTITPGGFDQDEIAFIVSEAAAVGLRVMAHANGEAAIISATKAGACSIEHGFFMTERALELIAKHGTYWTPTVGALKRAAKPDTVSNEMKASIVRLIRSHLEMIRKAYETNVLLAVGTDCVLPDPDYKKAYDAELSYFEQAGIPHEAVIKIACESGGKLLEM